MLSRMSRRVSSFCLVVAMVFGASMLAPSRLHAATYAEAATARDAAYEEKLNAQYWEDLSYSKSQDVSQNRSRYAAEAKQAVIDEWGNFAAYSDSGFLAACAKMDAAEANRQEAIEFDNEGQSLMGPAANWYGEGIGDMNWGWLFSSYYDDAIDEFNTAKTKWLQAIDRYERENEELNLASFKFSEACEMFEALLQ